MSWFKKLFQGFRSEEDEYIDEIEPQKQNSSQRDNNGVRDVDAKIVYQYPKGQFRFPLIPDEDEKRPSSPRRQNTNKVPVKKEVEVRTQKSRPSKHQSTKSVSENIKEMPIQKKKVSSGPFRPTEIPSPIYGFDRREKKSDPIEFDLDSFSNTRSRQTVIPVEMAKHEDEQHVTLGTYGDNSINSSSGSVLPADDAVAITQYVRENEGSVEINRQVVELAESNQENKEIHPPVNVESTSFPTDAVSEESNIETTTNNEAIDLQIVEEAPISEEKNDEVEPSWLQDEILDNNLAFNENRISENENNFKTELEVETVTVNEPATLEEAIEEPIELKREEKRRSHIPFNVIMLKEDRRKWEEKNRPIEHQLRQTHKEVSAAVEETTQIETIEEDEPYYVFPSLDILKPPVFKNVDKEWLDYQEQLLNETLVNFNVRASVANVTQGPSVTRFEVHPEPGVKVNKITNLSDDIKLSLAAKDIRMEAPIPGTHMIGIEVPNETSRPVFISEIITSEEFSTSASPLTAVLGLDISGKPIVTDLRKMPHGLIAGATGSGKSVCINSILISLLYKANPNEVKLLLIDPKMVELAPYNEIPHLVSPVITDVKAATAALKWAVDEMERRYELFAHAGVRDITRYNDVAEKEKRYSVKLPYIVIVIDELADLMMMSPADVEEAICRIAQKARACGIHLIIATQRPSVDVITGLIKANVPTRIAFSVSSQIDSRTIIDISGAERLLGRGDMLFLENGSSKPVRLQGTFVTDEEIDEIVAHVRREQRPQYLFEQEELLKKAVVTEEEDELFYEACEFIIEQGVASTSSLQRKFKIGYNRAARLIDMMEENGFISEAKGSKPRDVLITESELETFQEDLS